MKHIHHSLIAVATLLLVPAHAARAGWAFTPLEGIYEIETLADLETPDSCGGTIGAVQPVDYQFTSGEGPGELVLQVLEPDTCDLAGPGAIFPCQLDGRLTHCDFGSVVDFGFLGFDAVLTIASPDWPQLLWWTRSRFLSLSHTSFSCEGADCGLVGQIIFGGASFPCVERRILRGQRVDDAVCPLP